MGTDFDFIFGKWRSHHRRRHNPLTGSDSWYEFDGHMVARPILGGRGNIDEVDFERPDGRALGATLRLFDPKTQLWSIYWANSVDGKLDQPVVGRFVDGRGEFYSHELYEGRPIFVRFIWSDITPTSCRWQQAFSADGGRPWETNWTAEFTRVE